ncbi:PaaI family thioesterase [Frisingicoccus sp.]|uniref:PaaI family thioesterase n=1 Tax=Frisingicoccus sp. TaxID=1918627 RepID=UPI00386F578D
MEIKKTRLDNIGYVHPESMTIRDQEFCIGFNVINISKGECVNFGGDGISRYHIVLEGEVQGRYQDGRTVTIQTGETFGCEKEDLLEIKGDAKIFNMLMVGGIRGFIRTKILTQTEKLTVGEGVGESYMAILSPNGNFTLEYNKEKIYCEMGHAIVVQTDKKEFLHMNIIPEKANTEMVFSSGVQLLNCDFGKFIGTHFLERSAGYCKARLDIKPEHMNPIGTVHGGCLFTLADAVCGMAASSEGSVCTTVDSHIQFLNGAFWPKYLIAEAKPKKIGRKIRNFLVEITDDKGTLICTADFIFYSLQD